MARIKNGKLAGGTFIAASLILFGKETLLWAWNRILDIVSKGASADMSLAAVPWQNLIASLMGLAGLSLLFWPTKKAAKPSRATQLYRLYQRADHFVSRVRHDRRLSWYERDGSENRGDLARDGISLLLSFQSAGLPTPEMQTQSAEKICVGLETYFSQLMPFMRDGQLGQIDAMVSGAAKHGDSTAEAFDARTWFIEQA